MPVVFLLMALLLAPSLRAQSPVFNLPSQLDVTAINGVTNPDGPVITSNLTVSAAFTTDAVQNATWIVYPIGTTGSSAVYPPTDSVGVNISPAQANSPVTVQLGIKAIAPAAATTLPAFTGAGSMQVIVDTEPPEVEVTQIQIGDETISVTPSTRLHVNQDFTVIGTVTDNVSKAEDIEFEARMGAFESGSVQAEAGGRFEIPVSVGSLADGEYDLEILASDKTDDESKPNRQVFRLDL